MEALEGLRWNFDFHINIYFIDIVVYLIHVAEGEDFDKISRIYPQFAVLYYNLCVYFCATQSNFTAYLEGCCAGCDFFFLYQ